MEYWNSFNFEFKNNYKWLYINLLGKKFQLKCYIFCEINRKINSNIRLDFLISHILEKYFHCFDMFGSIWNNSILTKQKGLWNRIFHHFVQHWLTFIQAMWCNFAKVCNSAQNIKTRLNAWRELSRKYNRAIRKENVWWHGRAACWSLSVRPRTYSHS